MLLCLRSVAGVVFSLSLCLTLAGQDTRTVTEPVLPRPCQSLTAQLTSTGGRGLAEADETKLDTARIQEAVDACTAGHAVELKADSNQNAFLSGPLNLRSGVTLLI